MDTFSIETVCQDFSISYLLFFDLFQEEPFFPVKEGFTFLNAVLEEDRVRSTLPPTQKEDCEVGIQTGLVEKESSKIVCTGTGESIVTSYVSCLSEL